MKLNEALGRSRRATKWINIQFADFPEGYDQPKRNYTIMVLSIILLVLIAVLIYFTITGINVLPDGFDLIKRASFA